MKASEMIELLEKHIEDYGDWEVIGAIDRKSVYDEETEELMVYDEMKTVDDIKVSTAHRGEQKVFILR